MVVLPLPAGPRKTNRFWTLLDGRYQGGYERQKITTNAPAMRGDTNTFGFARKGLGQPVPNISYLFLVNSQFLEVTRRVTLRPWTKGIGR